METKVLTLYLENGKTLRFNKVTNFKEVGRRLTFNYFSTSGSGEQQATFDVEKIIGVSHDVIEDTPKSVFDGATVNGTD